MLDRADSAVLLVKAIEESDRTGALLPLSDREHASRETLRELGLSGERLRDRASRHELASATQRRAERLLQPLQQKYPVVIEILDRARWPAWLTWTLLLAALAAGFAGSALGAAHRIDILAFPFLGLIAWNLLVYLALAITWLRKPASSDDARPRGATRLLTRSLGRTLQSLARRTSSVHAALGRAMSQFATEWSTLATPLIGQHLRRLLHLAAASLGIGLLVGLYLRGVVLRYEAGWESTFLGPSEVQRVIDAIYAIPSFVTGVALPASVGEVAALRWDAAGRGADAAPWIHLLAASLMIYVVLPRSVLAVAAVWKSRRLRSAPWPLATSLYARRVFGATARGTPGFVVQVLPYAYELDAAKLERLDSLLDARFGGDVRPEPQGAIAYGDEAALEQLLDPADGRSWDARVLLFGLATTPETENHGAVIRALRNAAERSTEGLQALVAVDESAMTMRFGSDPSLAGRIDERRKLWRAFVAGHGLEAWFVDLARPAGRPDAAASA